MVGGASGFTFASEYSDTTVYSAKVEQPMKWRMSSPSRESRVVPSGRLALVLLVADREEKVCAVVQAVDTSPHRAEQDHDVIACEGG